VEEKLLGGTFFSKGLETLDVSAGNLSTLYDETESFVPRDTSPLSLTALSSSLQWIDKAIGMVDLVDARLTSRAQFSSRARGQGISLDLDQTSIV
jgi:hypothetical protein